MPTIDDRVLAALRALPPKPLEGSKQSEKKRYSELASQRLAAAFADELRARGLANARPAGAGELDASGAERRMAGGIGAKKVDVTWATEESGLLLGISIKTINFRDEATKNFQKNLTNRRSDMLIEAVTLHRRFPYAVLFGFFFLDKGAAEDGTEKRKSTFVNAHSRLRLFDGRSDPAGRDEQFERLYLFLLDASSDAPGVTAHRVGDIEETSTLDEVVLEIVNLLAERNPDFYEVNDGRLVRTRG